jgi:crotonobetainyl-CoA:carnitine CoA-transferase CaiB-like acyl-CoA transferase
VTFDPQADGGFAPLDGVRVLDLTSSLAGPSCTQLLAALGADVVKVEHPVRGDEARAWGPPFASVGSALFYAANAGKRSLGLDVKSDAGREVAVRLADRADVYVQSMRPGTAERLGLGPDALRARNPRLVTCSIGAYGTTGPLRDLPGYDPLMQAAAGIVSLTGEADRPGVRVGTSLVDLGTGLWAALGIVAALHERARTGRGRAVDVSLYETALGLVPYQLIAALDAGARPARHGTAFALIAPYQVFPTADGELMVAAANDGLFRRLCEVLRVPELADDPRFATNPLRIEHRAPLVEALTGAFRARPTGELLEALHAAGVPAAPVRELAEVAADEQTQALGILQQLGERHTVAPPLSLDGERVLHRSPPPGLGEQSREILREAGYTEEEIGALVEAGVVST